MNQSYSKGISWINDVRIPFVDENTSRKVLQTQSWANTSLNGVGTINDDWTQGRFPANLLVSDDMLNDGVISKSNDNTWIGGMEKNWKGHTNKRVHTYTDKGTNSRFYSLDKWFEKLLNED